MRVSPENYSCLSCPGSYIDQIENFVEIRPQLLRVILITGRQADPIA